MASKIIFAVVAGLLMCQVVLATHQVQHSGTQLTASSSAWIFQKIIAVLEGIEQRVDSITAAVAEGIDDAVDRVENTTLAIVEKVESGVNAVVDKIAILEDSVGNCTSRAKAGVSAALEEVREAGLDCVLERVAKVQSAAKKLTTLKTEFESLLAETAAAEKACAAKRNTFVSVVCSIEKGAELLVRAAVLTARFDVAAALVLAEVAAIVPVAAVCTGVRVAEAAVDIGLSLAGGAVCILAIL